MVYTCPASVPSFLVEPAWYNGSSRRRGLRFGVLDFFQCANSGVGFLLPWRLDGTVYFSEHDAVNLSDELGKSFFPWKLFYFKISSSLPAPFILSPVGQVWRFPLTLSLTLSKISLFLWRSGVVAFDQLVTGPFSLFL